MDKLLDKIVTDFGTYSYKIDTGLRGEIENMEKEIEAIQYKIKEKKQEAVDMGLAKIIFGLGKGKKKFDKRHSIKEKDWNIKKERLLKNN